MCCPLAAVGRFFATHYEKSRHTFRLAAALAEYQALERIVVSLETATEDAYASLKNSLGHEWSELTFIDSQNRSFDRLGHGICEVISFYPALLPALSERTWGRIEFLAALGNSFATTCLRRTVRPEPPPHPGVAAEL